MTDDPRNLHTAALSLADDHVATVGASDLGRPTPCAEWTLADLLAHMIGQHFGFARSVRDGDAPVEAYVPVPFTLDAWRTSVADLVAAFAGADVGGTAIERELAPVPLPIRRIVDAQLIDTVVHTWDVARALGRDFTPPEALLAATASIAAGLPDQAYGPDAAFSTRLDRPGTVWSDTLALVGRSISAED